MVIIFFAQTKYGVVERFHAATREERDDWVATFTKVIQALQNQGIDSPA
jgi:hypothetical protein